ncbi:putative MFS family arabinose efflux permease [Paenibacillus taihuensis]|uniref:Putative MFS family arabinose efflux permease n=1 Tax=Paenibacillus taihuensis TaxID=1156355 RepID=A0A3D9SPQ1_9BACL|nr:MFS transporter [Paenibacillus taihuensis]REE91666.1 putative MFS family arabinose efflux permease [Paenibacillus taihuensis]
MFRLFMITFGIFGIINTELGIVGILPQVSNVYGISASQAGLLVSLFALVIALFGPVMTLLFSGINHKKMMIAVLSVFVICSVVGAFAPNYPILVIARIIPAFLHPVYFSVAFIAAANSVIKDQSMKAVGKVFMGVTAGLVLGIPVTSFIADVVSLRSALLFSGAINAIAMIGIVAFLPSMPVQGRMSYSAQLGILRRPQVWLSLIASTLVMSGIFSVYSYFAEYLGQITHMSGKQISLMLIVYGVGGMIGNLVAGYVFSKNMIRAALIFPFIFGFIYMLVEFFGRYSIPMAVLVLLWGIITTIGLNFSQLWITSIATDAPEFSNGLFVSFSNLGITLGTFVGGLFISYIGLEQIAWSGIILLSLGVVMIVWRVRLYDSKKSLPH